MHDHETDPRVVARPHGGWDVTTSKGTYHVLENSVMGWGVYTGPNLDLAFADGRPAIGVAEPDGLIRALLDSDTPAAETGPEQAVKLPTGQVVHLAGPDEHTAACGATYVRSGSTFEPTDAEINHAECLAKTDNYAQGLADGAAAHRREGVYNPELMPDRGYRKGIQAGRAAEIDRELAALAEPPVHPRIANDRRAEATRRGRDTGADRQALRQAYQRLDALPEAGEETPEFLAANAAVGEAHDRLPWHKRIDIDVTRGRGAQTEQTDEDIDGM